jgi:hypothetical protein
MRTGGGLAFQTQIVVGAGPSLKNAHQPSQEGIEGCGVEQEVGHAQKRYQDERSVNPVPDGWPQSGHRTKCDRIGLPRNPKLSAEMAAV